MRGLSFHVICLCLLHVVFVLPVTFSQKDSRLKSLHSFNAIGIVQDSIPQISAFHDLKNDSNISTSDFILSELSKLGIDPEQLLTLFIRTATDKCLQDLIYTFENVIKPDAKHLWAINFLDSYGKLGSGVLNGNFKWLGDFNECVNIYAPPKENSSIGNFHGQYCTLQVSLTLPKVVIPVSSGVCLPDSCNSATLGKELQEFLNVTGLEPFIKKFENVVNVTSLDCKPVSKQYTSPAIFMICLLSFFGILAFIGSSITVYEYICSLVTLYSNDPTYNKFVEPNDFLANVNNEKAPLDNISADDDVLVISKSGNKAVLKHCKEFFKCFCVLSNGQKLLDTSSSEGQLHSINGIRFLSMCWVILCHVYAFIIANISNMAEVPNLINGWPFLIILQGFYSVDSFFVLSGFLMAYLFFQEYQKKDGSMSWLSFYIHRYIRLTPVYMIVLGFSTALFTYLGSGPFWPDYEIEPLCQKHWWMNILYINNFSPMSDQCIAWSWYLANDMQFFVVSPLFLITLWRWPKVGFSLLGLSLCGSIAANFGITYHYNSICGLTEIFRYNGPQELTLRMNGFFDYIYIKPYTRIGPYLVGIALGYYLFKRKQHSESKDSWVFLTCGWIISTAVTLTCMFSLYHRELSLLDRSFFNAFNRTCYAASLSWVIYTCLTGQGGPVNSILSYKLFMPLSRLTYVAYLIHPLVLMGFIANMKFTLPFSHVTMVLLFFGLTIITYLLSFMVSILFESPIIRLEKYFRGKKS